MFSGVFVAEEVDEVGKKWSGDTTVFDVQTVLEAFLNMSLKSAYFIDDAFFSGKKQLFVFWDSLPQLDCQNFHIVGC